jgi:hypothetical protein
MADASPGWKQHHHEQIRHVLTSTFAERLRWLEEACALAEHLSRRAAARRRSSPSASGSHDPH